MEQTKIIMGMPITIKILDHSVTKAVLKDIFDYFKQVDARFSTYKKDSEISIINKGLDKSKWSREMRQVLDLCELTKDETNGYFNINHQGQLDPSGLVKGWALYNAAKKLLKKGHTNFYIDGAGDVQVHGLDDHKPWVIGIRNPFNPREIVKKLQLTNKGAATSGTYIRGQHIYNPLNPKDPLDEVKSLTVIGPNVYEADRFATAAFAMGKKGINFIESKPKLEAYMITNDEMATYTSGFERFVFNA